MITCYEKAYYLNLGRYGAKNINTEYFKLKLQIINEQNNRKIIKQIEIGNSVNNSSQFKNLNYSNSSFDKNKNNNKVILFDEYTNTKVCKNEIFGNIHEGTYSIPNLSGSAQDFKYTVTYSNRLEPWICSIYLNYDDRDDSFIANLYFDKNKLCKILHLGKLNNEQMYSKKIINL